MGKILIGNILVGKVLGGNKRWAKYFVGNATGRQSTIDRNLCFDFNVVNDMQNGEMSQLSERLRVPEKLNHSPTDFCCRVPVKLSARKLQKLNRKQNLVS